MTGGSAEVSKKIRVSVLINAKHFIWNIVLIKIYALKKLQVG